MKYILIGTLSILLFSCGNPEQIENQEKANSEGVRLVQEIMTPADSGSTFPNLHLGESGTAYMTWTTATSTEKSILYYSAFENEKWEPSIQIAEGENWVVNWADFPSLISFGGSSFASNYLVTSNPETYAYDVNLTIANNNGMNWNTSFVPHKDSTETEHGFVSLVPYAKNSFMAIWLDGRKYDAGKDEMTLRAAIINKNGKLESEYVLDERVCDCCATDAIKTKDGIAVVYRNRDENEVRDMSIVYFKDGKWTKPVIAAIDNWIMPGCPVNGPAIDAFNSKISLAWFTLINDTPTVRFAFTDQFGNPFNPPIKINTTTTIGRVDVCAIDKETSVISWMEESDKITYLKIRTVKTNTSYALGEPIIVSEIDGSRSSGFPKMVKLDNKLLFAWSDIKNNNIRTAFVNLSSIYKEYKIK